MAIATIEIGLARMTLNYLIVLFGVGLIGAAGFIIFRAQDSHSTEQNDIPSAGTNAKQVSGQRIRIQSGQELLNDVNRQKLVRQIHDGLGYSHLAFEQDVMPFLTAFAEFVQLIPASQSHHHAHPGGLLEHSLEVAIIALRRASQLELPANTPTEIRVKLAPAWKFGVLVAAMLHDVGKPLVSVTIELFEDEHSKDSIHWNPLFGAMNKHVLQSWYKLDFPENNAPYREHEKVAFYVFNEVVPFKTRNWLNQTDPNLIESLLVELSNASSTKNNTVWHDIVSPADQESVANNLRYGVRTRFAAARSLPMIEVMMNALRHMVNERGGFFTTSKDSGAELFYKDEKVYIMSKVLGDRLRSFVRENKMGSIPDDNLRIFSTFHEYVASMRNPMDESKTVWDVRIEMKSGGKTQLQQFTMLVFEASKLFQGSWRPAEYLGAIEPLGRADAVEEAESGTAKVVQAKEHGAIKDDFESPQTTAVTQTEDSGADEAVLVSQGSQPTETTSTVNANGSVAGGGESGGSQEPLASTDEVTELELMEFLNREVESIGAPIAIGNVAPRGAKTKTSEVIVPTKAPASATVKEIASEPVPAPSPPPQPQQNQVKPKKTHQTTAQIISALDAFLSPEDSSKEPSSYKPTNDATVLKVAMSPPDLETLVDLEMNRQIIVDNNAKLLEQEEPMSDETQVNLGKQFVNWIQNGIVQGEIKVNDVKGFIHHIPEGALIVTPTAFIQFSGASGSVKLTPTSFIREVQISFEKGGYHKKIDGNGILRVKVNVMKRNGEYPDGMNCYLIKREKLSNFFHTLPNYNAYLELEKKPSE